MTYSNNLDPNLPGQGEFARLGAGRIRSLTLAIKERLESVFVNADADPLVFKGPAVPVRMVTVTETYTLGFVALAGQTLQFTTFLPPNDSGAPTGSPVICNWEPSANIAQLGKLIVTAWYSGALSYSVYNPTASDIALNGETIHMTVLYKFT